MTQRERDLATDRASDKASDKISDKDKPVCIVTGAATGIGAACALRFAEAGWAVAIGNFDDTTRADSERVMARCRELDAPALIFDTDVGVDAQCKASVATVASAWRRIDALINCAGTTRYVPHTNLDDLDDVEFERVYRVNLIGMYQMTRAAAPLLRAASSRNPGRAGSVVNVSSLAGLNGTGSSIAYAASKGAVNTMTLSLARSLAPHVRVNALAPGLVDDGLLRRVLGPEKYLEVVASMTAASPLKRVSKPAEIADLAWFLTSHAPAVTGQILAAENGLLLATA